MKQNDTFFVSFMTPQEDKLYNKPAGADRKDGPMCQFSISSRSQYADLCFSSRSQTLHPSCLRSLARDALTTNNNHHGAGETLEDSGAFDITTLR